MNRYLRLLCIAGKRVLLAQPLVVGENLPVLLAAAD
jgi:hypothetical protein